MYKTSKQKYYKYMYKKSLMKGGLINYGFAIYYTDSSKSYKYTISENMRNENDETYEWRYESITSTYKNFAGFRTYTIKIDNDRIIKVNEYGSKKINIDNFNADYSKNFNFNDLKNIEFIMNRKINNKDCKIRAEGKFEDKNVFSIKPTEIEVNGHMIKFNETDFSNTEKDYYFRYPIFINGIFYQSINGILKKDVNFNNLITSRTDELYEIKFSVNDSNSIEFKYREKNMAHVYGCKLYYITSIKIQIDGHVKYTTGDNDMYIISQILFEHIIGLIYNEEIYAENDKMNTIDKCEENTKSALNYLCTDNKEYIYIESYFRKNKCITDYLKIESIKEYGNFSQILLLIFITTEYHKYMLIKNEDENKFGQIIKHVPKYIQEHVDIYNIKFFSTENTYINLSDSNFDYVFDSGNDGAVLIGENIYKQLKEEKCIFDEIPNIINNRHGVTAASEMYKTSWVILKMKFDKINVNNKTYIIYGIIDTVAKNQLLFNNEFMKTLYDDGYNIKYQYHKEKYDSNKEKTIKKIINSYENIASVDLLKLNLNLQLINDIYEIITSTPYLIDIIRIGTKNISFDKLKNNISKAIQIYKDYKDTIYPIISQNEDFKKFHNLLIRD
jgi:hypothetical protein